MTFWQVLTCLAVAVATIYFVFTYLASHYTIIYGDYRMDVRPLRFTDPSPERLETQMDLLYLTHCLSANRCGMGSGGEQTERGFLRHMSVGGPPRTSLERHLIYISRREDGPYVRLDDFLTKELFVAQLKLEGDRLQYFSYQTGELLRETTCDALKGEY